MRSVMEHTFSEVPHADIPRSSFDRSHGHKTTFDADWLIPILVDDVIPGDSYNVDCNFFARLGSPTLHPLMDNLYLETFFFFVPYRLVWDNWERFMGAQDDPDDTIDYTVPKLSSDIGRDFTAETTAYNLSDYFGLPYFNSVDTRTINRMPYDAYNLIWNEWFRDQNLQDSVTVDTATDGFGNFNNYELLKRGKRHDYFTSSLPWPQKGDAVQLPLIGNAPVTVNLPSGANDVLKVVTAQDGNQNDMLTSGAALQLGNIDNEFGQPLYADLTQVTAATINDLRLAFQTQRLLERDARSGTRYTELLLAHFGVTSPDFRLQRPEFLGGGSSIIRMNEVPNTAGGAVGAEQAALAAHGTSAGSHGFTKSFVEHGVIIGLANVRSDITYSQGAERYWWKDTRFDFYFPVLSQIGEQGVQYQEIWYENTANDTAIWGYQERYAEYRYKPSRVTRQFRPTHATSLASWHLSEEFGSRPALNETFIESNTGSPLDRAIQVPSEPQIIADFYFRMICARPMPLYGVPGNLDQF